MDTANLFFVLCQLRSLEVTANTLFNLLCLVVGIAILASARKRNAWGGSWGWHTVDCAACFFHWPFWCSGWSIYFYCRFHWRGLPFLEDSVCGLSHLAFQSRGPVRRTYVRNRILRRLSMSPSLWLLLISYYQQVKILDFSKTKESATMKEISKSLVVLKQLWGKAFDRSTYRFGLD